MRCAATGDVPQRARDHRAPGRAPDRGSSTTCSTSRASRAARSSCAASTRRARATWSRRRSRWPARCSRSARHQLTSTCRRAGLLRRRRRARLAQVVSNLLTTRPSTPSRAARSRVARARRRRRESSTRRGQRHRHRAGAAAARLRAVRAGARRRSIARRAGSASGSRSCAASSSCTAARSRRAATGAGRGSAFVVRLPRGGRAERARPRPTPRRSPQVRAARACSSSTTTRTRPSCSRELLEQLGHDVRVALRRPGGARSRSTRFAPDVALLDIGLPVMDGYELARTLRAPRRRGAALIALTGYGQVDGHGARSKAAGFDAHLDQARHAVGAARSDREARGRSRGPARMNRRLQSPALQERGRLNKVLRSRHFRGLVKGGLLLVGVHAAGSSATTTSAVRSRRGSTAST